MYIILQDRDQNPAPLNVKLSDAYTHNSIKQDMCTSRNRRTEEIGSRNRQKELELWLQASDKFELRVLGCSLGLKYNVRLIFLSHTFLLVLISPIYFKFQFYPFVNSIF